MAHMLFKPHVFNSDGDIVTPDLVIDRLSDWETGAFIPAQRISSATSLQTLQDRIQVCAGVLLVAAGGGTLMAPVACVKQDSNHSLGIADFVVARGAWRVKHIQDRSQNIRITLGQHEQTVSSALQQSLSAMKISLTEDFLTPYMLRGCARVLLPNSAQLSCDGNASFHFGLSLDDHDLDLEHQVNLSLASSDAWPERPAPRYAVGPRGEVKHYI